MDEELIYALEKAGIDPRIPRDMVAVAEGFVRTHEKEFSRKVTGHHDPEGMDCVDVEFLIPGTLEWALDLDFRLIELLVRHFPHIPYEFVISIVPMENV
jgi:hypothetical protein